MASSCNINGIVGVRNGRAFTYEPRKNFWKHDGFLPLQSGDHPVDFFTFGGGSSAPLEDGVYFAVARVVARATAGADPATDEPVLQLFGSDECPVVTVDDRMPPPVFVAVGRVARTDLEVDNSRAFDIDVSQYGATAQQLIRLRCFYPNDNTRFMNTPLPTTGKHVVVHAHLPRFESGRFLLRVLDITLGPGDLSGATAEIKPSTKLGGFDWKGAKGKRARIDSDLKGENDAGSQSGSASGSQAAVIASAT